MEFRKRFVTTIEDLTSYSIFNIKKFLIPILLLCSAALIILNLDDMSGWWITLITMIITIGLFALLFVVILKRNLKKQYNSNKLMQAENDVIMDEAGLHISAEHGNTNIVWNNVSKAAESKNGFYVYIANMQAFIIPKRLLSAEEEATIRSLIQTHLPPEKNKLNR